MFRLKLIPDNSSFNFLNYFKFGFVFSAVLIVLSVSSYLFQGLNLGIDFKGGTLIAVSYTHLTLPTSPKV